LPPIDYLSATIADAKKAAKLSAEKVVRVAI
jgi:hypothetical protein